VTYRLAALGQDETRRWDELTASYQDRRLFQRRAWLDYLSASRGAEIRMLAILKGEERVGYLCGGILRKGPFRVFGSPLTGWGTNHMGPLTYASVNQDALLEALDCWARDERLSMTEIDHPMLLDVALERHTYRGTPLPTYVVSLASGNQEGMWTGLKSTARNRIRKALKAGLSVEETKDPRVAEEFYDQYLAVTDRRRTAPTYPRSYPRLLVSILGQADLLWALRVRDQNGRVLATGLFPHDEHAVYFWGGACWREALPLCPNDLLHWQLMCLAATRGLDTYNMCGIGQFKRKFGGRVVVTKRWHKCYSLTATVARAGYGFYFRRRLHLGGLWRRLGLPEARA